MKTKQGTDNLNIPDHHNQAYVYAGVHLNKKEHELRSKKKITYAYHKSEIWNFDCDAIKPLLNFLRNSIN